MSLTQPRPPQWVHLLNLPLHQSYHDAQGTIFIQVPISKTWTRNQSILSVTAHNTNHPLSTIIQCPILRPLSRLDSLHIRLYLLRVFHLPLSITALLLNTHHIPIPRSAMAMDIPLQQLALLCPVTTYHQFKLINQGYRVSPLIQRTIWDHGIPHP